MELVYGEIQSRRYFKNTIGGRVKTLYNVIGTKNCSKCQQLKLTLNKKEVPYQYFDFTELSNEIQDKYLQIAKQNLVQSFPLVFDENNEFINIDVFKGE
jgi:glutaredoxin